MRRAIACAVVGGLLLMAGGAAADPDVTAEASPRNAVSVHVLTLGQSGGAAQVERDTGWRKTSVAVGLGLYSAAMGDYDSRTVGVGVELKRWFGSRPPMRGWFGALRLDVAKTSMVMEAEDREIGSSWTTTLSLAGGYRWLLWSRVELTPSLGFAVVRDSGERSPVTARAVPLLGLTAGWMF